jgi:hypothetical protein
MRARLAQNVSAAVNFSPGYHSLVDIRDNTFHPEMIDLLEIAAECSKQLIGFGRKIAFLIPDTEQRKRVAKIFKTGMETEGFEFEQFIDCEAALEWLGD